MKIRVFIKVTALKYLNINSFLSSKMIESLRELLNQRVTGYAQGYEINPRVSPFKLTEQRQGLVASRSAIIGG